MRIKAVVAYDGTDYHGFQRQAPAFEPTIQGQLEAALERIKQSGTVWGAGRTDSGVLSRIVAMSFCEPRSW